ncbi:hypothetical protein [Puniceicoccus vermicola]|uniref:hypothetical protein n=1 Tax=Puniceicoccus vermicola TaxID=388746 RepID=UPI0033980C76
MLLVFLGSAGHGQPVLPSNSLVWQGFNVSAEDFSEKCLTLLEEKKYGEIFLVTNWRTQSIVMQGVILLKPDILIPTETGAQRFMDFLEGQGRQGKEYLNFASNVALFDQSVAFSVQEGLIPKFKAEEIDEIQLEEANSKYPYSFCRVILKNGSFFYIALDRSKSQGWRLSGFIDGAGELAWPASLYEEVLLVREIDQLLDGKEWRWVPDDKDLVEDYALSYGDQARIKNLRNTGAVEVLVSENGEEQYFIILEGEVMEMHSVLSGNSDLPGSESSL